MLVKLLTIICSFFVPSVLALEMINPILYNESPQPSYLYGIEPNFHYDKVDVEVPVAPLIKPTSPTICSNNEILLQIENILINLLQKVHIISNEYKNMNTVQEANEMLTNMNIPSFDAEKKNFAFSSIPAEFLRELLVENKLTRNLNKRISVQYKLPSEAQLSCKQALAEVLAILSNSYLLHNSRSCSSCEHCYNKKIVIKDPAENNDNVYSNDLPSHGKYTSNLMNKKLDWMKLINYIAPKQNDLHDIYETKEQEVPYIIGAIKVPNAVNEPLPSNGEPVPAYGLKKNLFNKSPYHILVTENILASVQTANNFNNKSLNLSEIIGDNLVESNKPVPIAKKIQHATDVGWKPDHIFIKKTNNIVSSNPTEDQLSRNSNKKVLNGNEKYNVDTKVVNNRINAILSMTKSGDERTKMLSNLIQSNFHFQQLPQQTSDTIRYPHLLPYYIESNKRNPLNTVSNQGNVWPKPGFRTPRVGVNRYFVNPKLVDYGKYVNQLHTSNNLENFPRMVGVTNQLKLNAAPDSSDVVELTYVLRRPISVAYQPIYFVKYHVPYNTFLKNARYLLEKKPQLRFDPAQTYHKLLAASKIAEISPSLKGVNKQNLLEMVSNNGALVKTKVLKVNDTFLNKQLGTRRELNSNTTPRELISTAYSIGVETKKASDFLKNDIQDDPLNELSTPKANRDINSSEASISQLNKLDDKNIDSTTKVLGETILRK